MITCSSKAWKKFVPDNTDKKDKAGNQEANGKNSSVSAMEKKNASGGGSDKNLIQHRASATADEVRLGCRRLLATALRGTV